MGLSLFYTGLGDHELAISSLHGAFDELSYWLLWPRVDPAFHALEAARGFQDLSGRMDFPN